MIQVHSLLQQQTTIWKWFPLSLSLQINDFTFFTFFSKFSSLSLSLTKLWLIDMSSYYNKQQYENEFDVHFERKSLSLSLFSRKIFDRRQTGSSVENDEFFLWGTQKKISFNSKSLLKSQLPNIKKGKDLRLPLYDTTVISARFAGVFSGLDDWDVDGRRGRRQHRVP